MVLLLLGARDCNGYSMDSVEGGGVPWVKRRPCRSGLVSRKGRAAAPAIEAVSLKSWGRCAALSRHKAAPTESGGVAYGISRGDGRGSS
ncbi:hypothetical protein DMX06_04845 [Pseudomonas mosselii]|nr:hypothetical protein DMX06_04845 [Pseudomonas mosselii]